ncbi:hypothetical protein [Acinetobacter baumannii]
MSEIRPYIHMELSPEEQQIILERRAEEAHIAATEAFQIKVLNVANLWMQWSEKEGSGLTLSTFQSSYEFNYLEADLPLMYEAVKKIMQVVHSLQVPREKSQC